MIIKQHTNLHKNSHDKFDCIISQSIKTWWMSINTKNCHDKFDCIISCSVKTWWMSINTKTCHDKFDEIISQIVKTWWVNTKQNLLGQIWLYNFTNHQNVMNKQTKTQKLSWHDKNMCKIFMITWNCDEYKL